MSEEGGRCEIVWRWEKKEEEEEKLKIKRRGGRVARKKKLERSLMEGEESQMMSPYP